MRDSPDDFGTTALTNRELRNVFLVLSAAVVLLLLFGVGLAMRLRSSAELLSGDVASVAVMEAEIDSVIELGVADSVVAEISTARAVLPTVDDASEPRFGVRVGIFAIPENADRMLVRLQDRGYAPFVIFQRSADRTLRYVYAATASSEAEAMELAATLEDALGMSTYVEAVDPNR